MAHQQGPRSAIHPNRRKKDRCPILPTDLPARGARPVPPSRRADPPRHGAYLRIQPPLTRSARVRLVSEDEYFAAIGAQADGVAYCRSKPPETDPKAIELRQAWLAEHPPLGWPVPRWRWQWPVTRVPAGMHAISDRDFALSERTLWAGVGRGLDTRSQGGTGEQDAK